LQRYTDISYAKKQCNNIDTCLCIDNFIQPGDIKKDVSSYRLVDSNSIDNSEGVLGLEKLGYCSPKNCQHKDCFMPCKAHVKEFS
jgi:hypothetical protein